MTVIAPPAPSRALWVALHVLVKQWMSERALQRISSEATMRFRPRDHERFIGSYDPEHEMPDPDRDARDRWQSDAYRRNARDSRYFYRWNPDRYESRDGRTRDIENEIQPRDRYEAAYRAGYEAGYDRGYRNGYTGYNDRRGYDWDRDWSDRQDGHWRERDRQDRY